MKKGRSNRTIVHSAIDVKTWLSRVPSVDEVRPGQCPRCAAASRPVGQGLQIWGHGLRDRQSRGPLEPLGDPVEVTLRVRRYVCRPCGAVIAVVPLGVVAGRLFAAMAIGLALTLFGVERLPLGKVRQRVSPWRRVGATAHGSWLAVRRWVRAIRGGRLFAGVRLSPERFTARQVAERAAMTLAALAPPALAGEVVTERVFAGAARAR
ncbi:MAG: hypothetical protein HY908_08490 [Myxococcales bacterium]|nr:hypothetical protein [Myxococcales bacterium]